MKIPMLSIVFEELVILLLMWLLQMQHGAEAEREKWREQRGYLLDTYVFEIGLLDKSIIT
jgi:hypothetical protein